MRSTVLLLLLLPLLLVLACGVQRQQAAYLYLLSYTCYGYLRRPEAARGCDLAEVGVEEAAHLRVLDLDYDRLAAL